MTSTYANYLLPHIADMAPYTPIEPFEVLCARLGRSPNRSSSSTPTRTHTAHPAE